MIRLAILTLTLLTSCYHANGTPFTAVDYGRGAITVAHVVAKGLCLARVPLEALVVSAGLTMDPAAADLFCSAVAVYEETLARDANRVIPAGQFAHVPPTYLVGAHAFSVRVSP